MNRKTGWLSAGFSFFPEGVGNQNQPVGFLPARSNPTLKTATEKTGVKTVTRSKHDILKSLIVGWSLVDLCWNWGVSSRLAERLAVAGDDIQFLARYSFANHRLPWFFLLFITALLVKFDWERRSPLILFPSTFALLYGLGGLRSFWLTRAGLVEDGASSTAFHHWFWLDTFGVWVFPRFICGVALFLYSVAGLRQWLKSSKHAHPA